jgi:hypothetical protein
MSPQGAPHFQRFPVPSKVTRQVIYYWNNITNTGVSHHLQFEVNNAK